MVHLQGRKGCEKAKMDKKVNTSGKTDILGTEIEIEPKLQTDGVDFVKCSFSFSLPPAKLYK